MNRDQLHERLRLIAEDMRLEVEARRAELDRPKGGQTCGPRGGPLANAGPGVLSGVERWARFIDQAIAEADAALKARAVNGDKKDARSAMLAIAARLDRAADAKAAALVAGGVVGSVASIVYELRAFAAELRKVAEEADR